MGGHVFVSYSRLDAEYVARLKVRLLSTGIEMWTDEGIDGGAEWLSVLERKIETCAVFVPVMSDHSREAPWVTREIHLAQELRKPIAPLRLGGRRFLSLRDIQDEDVSQGQLPSVRWIQRLRTLTGLPPSGSEEPIKPLVYMDAADVGPLWDSAGQVVAWGANDSEVTVLEGLADITDISASTSHCLALYSDGHVSAWDPGSGHVVTVPANISDVTGIAAGFGHSLALHSDGHVSAWGNNSSGQASVPDGLSNVAAIAAGGVHSVGLHRDGQITVWGYGGKPTTWLRNVTAVSAGISQGLALHEDGHITAWGSGDYSQASVPNGMRDVTKIAAGNFHNLVLHSDGHVAAWGGDLYGEATIPAGLSDVIEIAAGGHSLARRSDGLVVGWGDNGRATAPQGMRDVTKIAAGTSVSLAIVSKRFR